MGKYLTWRIITQYDGDKRVFELSQHISVLTALVPIITMACDGDNMFVEGDAWWKFIQQNNPRREGNVYHTNYLTCQLQFVDVPGNRCTKETVHECYMPHHKQRFSSSRDKLDRTASWKKKFTSNLITLSLLIPVTCTDSPVELDASSKNSTTNGNALRKY